MSQVWSAKARTASRIRLGLAALTFAVAAACRPPARAPADPSLDWGESVWRLYAYGRDGRSPGPLDLIHTGIDVNGLPLNPAWVVELRDRRRPDVKGECAPTAVMDREGIVEQVGVAGPCTNAAPYVTLTVPNEPRVLGLACGQQIADHPQGHLNYFPVTFDGLSQYWDYQAAAVKDKDVNFYLRQDSIPGGRQTLGLTQGNKNPRDAGGPGIELEFSAVETLFRFDTTRTPRDWWDSLRMATVGRNQVVEAALFGSRRERWFRTIVSGLYGIDAVHNYQAEIHPGWAMAFRVEQSNTGDRWALMLRVSGNEGECARGSLPFDFGRYGPDAATLRYSFSLPWPDEVEDIEIAWGDRATHFFASDPRISGPVLTARRGERIWAEFTLPKQPIGTMVYGMLLIRNRGGRRTMAQVRTSPDQSHAGQGSKQRLGGMAGELGRRTGPDAHRADSLSDRADAEEAEMLGRAWRPLPEQQLSYPTDMPSGSWSPPRRQRLIETTAADKRLARRLVRICEELVGDSKRCRIP